MGPRTTQKLAEEIDAEYNINKQGGLILNDDNDQSRRMVEHCYRTTKTMVNPIIDWTDEDVWEFLKHYGCKSNPLYECGFKRIGCIGCPMAGKHRYNEFVRYPTYKQAYIKAFGKMLDNRELGKSAKMAWQTGLDVFRWWMGEDFNQITFDDLMEYNMKTHNLKLNMDFCNDVLNDKKTFEIRYNDNGDNNDGSCRDNRSLLR